MSTLSEALHERLDAMGAPPREQAEAIEDDEALDEVPVDDDDDDGEPLEAEVEEESEEEGEEPESEGEADEGLASGKYKVAELAKAIGWSPADLYNELIVPLGNGETLTLGQLKNERETLAAQKADLDQARAMVMAEAEKVRRQQQEALTNIRGVSEAIDEARGEMRAIESQYSTVDWEKLDAQDPGRAANARQKFATAYAQAKAKLAEAEQKHQAEVSNVHQRSVQQEDQRTLALIPEWRDPQVVQAEMPQITQYLMSQGFSEAELGSIYNASARKVARDAWLYSQQQQATAKAVQAVRKAPKKVLRPGRTPGSVPMESKVKALEKRAIASGNTQDKLAAARAILQSSMKRQNRG